MTADFPSDAERNDETRTTAGDDAFARLEKEMAAMKNAIGGLSDQIADAAGDAGAATQEQAERGQRGLKYAREYAGANVDPMVAGASNRVTAAASAAQSQASSIAGTIEDAVRERPLSSVGFALGLGFLIGAICRR
jgi:ElaB/YqjD/DUF883 family membrane-anchored ribosome-binding protein